MFAYSPLRRALLCGLATLAISACGNDSPSRANDPSEAGVAQVDAAALKAAVADEASRSFYEKTGWSAVWSERSERLLVEALEKAPAHGLERRLYLDGPPSSDPAEREAALTKAALGYAKALAMGHTDPTELHEVYTLERPEVDLPAGLATAFSNDNLAGWLESLPPQDEEYRKLSQAFLDSLRQAGSAAEKAIQSGDIIGAGDRDPRVPPIAEALAANGYLDSAQAEAVRQGLFTPAMADALRRMQEDFGIKADGVVGPDTIEILDAGPRERARQLAVNLERRRWLKREVSPTRIDVNTAAAALEYWREGKLRDRRKVVVGEPGWETPPLGSPLFRLVANPTWTVPKSIEQDELADKGPGYLRRNNMVRRDGWIVQQPGPDNALGMVKFDLQNDQAIYLHDTPAKALFSQNERHRSHGCIRVENALGFASLIAGDMGVEPQFQQAMASGEEDFVRLGQQIPVRLLYHTAFVDPSGRIQFRTDAYGWDEKVARALGREARNNRTLRRHESGRDIGP